MSERMEILKTRDVARILNVTPSTIYRWRAAGIFPAPKRLGPRRVGYTRGQVEEWLESRPSADEAMAVAVQ